MACRIYPSAGGAGLYRAIAAILVLGLVLNVAGLRRAHAGTSVVRGKVVLQDGTPPPTGSMVQATPINGGETQFASIGENGTYIFSELPDGEYQFDVVGPDGTLFEPGAGLVQTLVPSSGVSVLNLDVISPAVAATAAAVPPPSEQPRKSKKRAVVWWTVGGVLGAVAIIALAGSDSKTEDEPLSPSAP